MISSFSSFIEFFAAIYVTMSVDTLFVKSFWTPDYYPEVKKTLSRLKIPTVIATKLSDSIAITAHNEQKKGSLLGVLLLLSSILFLFLVGFEPQLVEKNSVEIIQRYLFSLSLISSAVLVIYIFSSLFLAKVELKSTLISFGVLLIIVVLEMFVIPQKFIVIVSPNWTRILVICCLTMPVILQLVRNWLYSIVYFKYTEEKIALCYAKYQKALDFTPGDSITSIDSAYQNAVANAHIKHDNQDTMIDAYVAILNDDLKKYSSVPTVWNLVCSWMYFQSHYLFIRKKDKSVNVNVTNVNGIFNESVENAKISLEEQYNKWFRKRGEISIKNFCDEEKIDYKVFSDYHKNRSNRKK